MAARGAPSPAVAVIRTRFAPSPTGALHLGGARTALFNWLLARRAGGEFLLRIEDTDRARSTEAHCRQIEAALAWLGLDWDGPAARQSARAARHRERIGELLRAERAYCCDCPPERLEALRAEQQRAGLKPRYDGRCRARGLAPGPGRAVRLKTPRAGAVEVADRLKGAVRFDNAELDDLVIARAGGGATYHLAAVVDDIDAGVTHVLRGDDHFNNTPRQLHLYAAFGAAPPVYVHLPMILDAAGRKLSKRAGDVDVLGFRERGVLPSALLNALARLGWAHGDQELFDRAELVRRFGLDGLNRAPARLDPKKLAWLNREQLRRVPAAELEAEFAWHCARAGLDAGRLPAAARAALLDVQRRRCRDMAELAAQSRFLLEDAPVPEPAARARLLTPAARGVLEELRGELEAAADWSAAALDALLRGYCERRGRKPREAAAPLRLAVTGGTVSPGIGDTLALLGRERALARLAAALEEDGGAAAGPAPPGAAPAGAPRV